MPFLNDYKEWIKNSYTEIKKPYIAHKILQHNMENPSYMTISVHTIYNRHTFHTRLYFTKTCSCKILKYSKTSLKKKKVDEEK